MLVDEGVTSFKLFMAYPGVFYSTDAEILRAMQQASGDGATIMMHAENGIAIDLIVAETLARGETDPRFHAKSRPSTLEGEATQRAIRLAGSRVRRYTSSTCLPPKRSKPSCTRATQGGMCSLRPVRSICFSRTPISNGPGSRGPSMSARHPCAPSGIRRTLARAEDQRPVRCLHGSLPLLLQGTEGARARRLLEDPERAAGSREPGRPHLSGGRPRRHLGGAVGRDHRHYACAHVRPLPAEGRHRARADADIVVYDPAARQTISAATHHMNVDYSVYEGLAITGRVETVLSRGVVVVDEGQWAGEKGHGRFLDRGRNQYLI